MGTDVKSLEIDRLEIEERLALVDEIWASIRADAADGIDEAIDTASARPPIPTRFQLN